MIFTKTDTVLHVDGAIGKLHAITRAGNSEQYKEGWVAIICHPHPQHGGTMDNKVVTSMARACRDMGVDSVRFNYRGVGESEGSYGDVQGESEDLIAIVNAVQKARPEVKILLAGFSFGTGVVGLACRKISALQHIVLVAPPVGWYTYSSDGTMPVPVTVIQGEMDELFNASDVARWVDTITTPIEYHCIDEASHFFHGRLRELSDIVTDAFNRHIAAA